ncbi:MAG: beta-ketoacyl-[acyl-carrier-protein] synthase II, partial [Ethanoligenens sp.]
VVPPTANYKVKDPACDLDYVTEGARALDYDYAISNTMGFGGHNATLCLKKFRG